MKNLLTGGRIYGLPPFKTVILHGGPGAPGYMAPIAEEMSGDHGILEPFQSAESVNGQIQELREYLLQNAQIPIILIGHSWGSWLGFLFAARYPAMVGKLILVSAGPFEINYSDSILQTRLNRLSYGEKKIYDKLIGKWDFVNEHEQKSLLRKLGELMLKVDNVEPDSLGNTIIDYQPEIFKKVWNEASALRSSGALLEEGKKIKCPVVAIHGDYDPHPWQGIKEPLELILTDFEFFLLEKCGHDPWKEKQAREEFYRILRAECCT